jgi:CheY-like chemotaxis protein
MPPEVLDRALEPFFTTKEVGKGSGLGLPQVYGFVQQSGGRLRIDSRVQAGTTVTLLLPRSLHKPAALVEASTAFPVFGDGSDRQVLLVEDDVEVAALTREMLSHLGFNVIHVASPVAALGALANGRSIDVVLSDVMMPGGMSGIELAREIRRRQPGMPIVLTTGYTGATVRMNKAEFRLLLKPYSLEALADALSVEPR